jgi:hypothetical protein
MKDKKWVVFFMNGITLFVNGTYPVRMMAPLIDISFSKATGSPVTITVFNQELKELWSLFMRLT